MDCYLRGLLVMGARTVLNAAKGKTDSLSRWALAVQQRRGYWKAVVVINGQERAQVLGRAQPG